MPFHKLDKLLNLRIVPENPNIGLVIGTHGTVPYINLFLESARRNFSEIPILVSDDCSGEKSKLCDLSKKYHCDFYSNDRNYEHGHGDITVFINGLNWAEKLNLDIVVKMSRRFIPFFDWVSGLKRLAFVSQASTYTAPCRYFRFHVRTECVGMHVKSWLPFIGRLEDLFKNDVRVEEEIYPISVDVAKANHSVINQDYIYKHRCLFGYAIWDMLGDSRVRVPSNILWHDIYSYKKYYEKAKEYGINEYEDTDFKL